MPLGPLDIQAFLDSVGNGQIFFGWLRQAHGRVEEAEQASADDLREATSPKLDIGLREMHS